MNLIRKSRRLHSRETFVLIYATLGTYYQKVGKNEIPFMEAVGASRVSRDIVPLQAGLD